ncbi:MAG: indolepyruvate ferredoxin oxidoreductase, partial [Acidobacteria bacterium]|nr:indolepyruvate ferredoxin oxidoreductase [Acidobacteriota bacterium]
GMHSSQNEQDSRYYARFARIFCFEPADHQEAYDMTGAAFDLSEKYEIPVMLRMVTRLSHSRSGVVTGERRTPNEFRRGEGKDWTLLPANARRRFGRLLDIQADLTRESEKSPFNKLTINQGRKDVGIIASGIAVKYVFENLRDMKDAPSLLKISSYPLPESRVRELVDHVETVIVVEEGYPFIEEQIRGIFGFAGKNIRGKQSGDLSLTGELSPDIVRTALGLKSHSHRTIEDFKPAGRPPQLCAGCPHIDTFSALTELLSDFPEAAVFSDIGCYTLGALPPYNAIDSCVCMGASISMAKGASEAGLFPAVAVIGDSTFGHSGITSLLDAAFRGANMTVVIVDNATVAMTGGQPSFATGENLRRIVLGTGVEESHVRTITPLPRYKEDNKAVFREEIEHPGLSVILSVRACVQETKKLAKKRSA